MNINKYFDNVYVLNLHKRKERLTLTTKRLDFCDIKFETFGATDGSVMRKLWESYQKENNFFLNSNYIGCAISHLSIYKDAIEKGYERILILEDDNRVHREANIHFKAARESKSDASVRMLYHYDLMYLGFIPLSDDFSRWDYNICNEFLTPNVIRAKNLWGLYAYSPSIEIMKETLEVYDKSFPMELDRYFVTEVQPRGNSIGFTPQIFAADDGISDNSGRIETKMLDRSIDSRFANKIDYI